jgi:hypothetical protein
VVTRHDLIVAWVHGQWFDAAACAHMVCMRTIACICCGTPGVHQEPPQMLTKCWHEQGHGRARRLCSCHCDALCCQLLLVPLCQ